MAKTEVERESGGGSFDGEKIREKLHTLNSLACYFF
jgi:hypothetical protein